MKKIKVIRPQIVKYYCDKCGDLTGTRKNPKIMWYGPKGESYYCIKKCGGKP